MVEQAVLTGMLLLCTLSDIKRKSVNGILVLFFGIIGVVLHIVFKSVGIREILLGMLIGIIFMVLSVMMEGDVGLGDALVLLVSGIFLGFEKNLTLLVIALLLSGIAALILMVFFKKSKKYAIPFVPFLMVSDLIILGVDLCSNLTL